MEKVKDGYLRSTAGRKSSSRLIGFIIVVSALVFVQEILWFGRDNIIQAAISGGTLFITLAGPAMYFLFEQKKNEKTEGKTSQN